MLTNDGMKSLLFEERVTLAVLSIYIKRGNRTIPKFNRTFLRVCVCVSLEEVYFFWKIFIFLDLRLIDDIISEKLIVPTRGKKTGSTLSLRTCSQTMG